MLDPSMTKEQLHEDNAEDVYNALSELKGSALKVAQMLSMEKMYCQGLMSISLLWRNIQLHRFRVR